MFYREQQWQDLFRGRSILIAGYGREGKSSERLLSRLLPDGQFAVADGNENILREAPKYDLIIKSPGIPTFIFEGVCDLSKVSSQTDLFLQIYGDQTIGISGTKGKSTTTTLIAEILSRWVSEKSTDAVSGGRALPRVLKDKNDRSFDTVIIAGNMGIPLWDIVPELSESTLVVAELSCHQLENIHTAPHIGILLNLFQEHLDHYHDYDGYKNAKLNMARCQSERDFFYYCADNETLRNEVDSLAPHLKTHIISYSASAPYPCNPSPSLQGAHNLSNITVAALVAKSLGVSDEAISHVVSHFEGLPYRMQWVGKFQGIDFYDDSISTIPEAAMAAVRTLKRVDTLILGGFDRGIDYSSLALFLADSNLRNLVFVGKAGQQLLSLYRKHISEQQDKRNVLVEDDYRRIVDWCFAHTRPGGICLLSPAASSYDAFKNFEERGRLFDELVRNHTSPIVEQQNHEVASDVVSLRHSLHQHPGISGHESYAHDLIVAELKKLQPTCLHEHVGGYGVVAFWGDKSKPCIAFRADTDALPILETTCIDYRSESEGVSHKCGHDGHTATLLRLAQLIHSDAVRNPNRPLQVLLIFQPEEETGHGAQKIIDSGVLRQYQIHKFFAIHNLPGFPLNQIVMSRHTFAAASTGVVYRLKGRQTHASTPEKGLNPGLCVAEIIQAFSRMNSGENVPLDEFRQTTLVGVRLGEEAFGTSAGDAQLMFTLRAFTNSRMQQLLSTANRLVESLAAAHNLSFSYELREPFAATENSTALVDDLYGWLRNEGHDVVLKNEPFRWSEDFSNYLLHYEGCMFGIGAGENHPELHHPDYDFPDELIEPTAQLFLKIIKHLQ